MRWRKDWHDVNTILMIINIAFIKSIISLIRGINHTRGLLLGSRRVDLDNLIIFVFFHLHDDLLVQRNVQKHLHLPYLLSIM